MSGKTGVGVANCSTHVVRLMPAPGRRRRRSGAGDDLRLRLRHLPRRGHLRARRRRQARAAREDQDDVDRHHARAARSRHRLARPQAQRRPRRRRGGLPDHRRQGRSAVQGRRHRDVLRATAPPRRSPATANQGRWSTPASIRSTAPTTPTCATRWSGCSSTTPRWCGSPRPRSRWASGSAAASWACCTWRSPASVWSASSTST